MSNNIKDKVGKAIINILLFIVSICLSPLLFLSFSYTIVTKFSYTARYLKRIAFIIDIFGNVTCGQLFNDVLKKQNGYKFGYYKDTISYVLGRNEHDNTLTLCGVFVKNCLNLFEKNHCKKAFENKT